MKSPVCAFKVTDKGLVPHDHPAVKDKEFATPTEIVSTIQDWKQSNEKKPGPNGLVILQVYDF